MKKEFNLSLHEFPEGYFPKDKVKTAVKLLKEEMIYTSQDTEIFNKEVIDKIFGEKLT